MTSQPFSRSDDAETILVSLGSINGTIQEAVDEMAKGLADGLAGVEPDPVEVEHCLGEDGPAADYRAEVALSRRWR